MPPAPIRGLGWKTASAHQILNSDYRKPLVFSHLKIPSLEIRPFLQKNRGPTEIILHFFLRFSTFSGFFPPQPIASQLQAAIRTRQMKSYQKHYRRFLFVPGYAILGA
jgi:hypothetical protein